MKRLGTVDPVCDTGVDCTNTFGTAPRALRPLRAAEEALYVYRTQDTSVNPALRSTAETSTVHIVPREQEATDDACVALLRFRGKQARSWVGNAAVPSSPARTWKPALLADGLCVRVVRAVSV